MGWRQIPACEQDQHPVVGGEGHEYSRDLRTSEVQYSSGLGRKQPRLVLSTHKNRENQSQELIAAVVLRVLTLRRTWEMILS